MKTTTHCASCKDDGIDRAAVRLMPWRPDGQTVAYSPECDFHAAHWWDGADWDGRHMEKPITEHRQQ